MFIESVKSDGLAHLSYLVGDDGQAAVIDPRRDCDVYIRMARARGCRITRIFETHRNEDLVSGAPMLAAMTGAEVCHGPNPAAPVAYARTVGEGESFDFGQLRLRVLETPGHTDDSLTFALFDLGHGEQSLAAFTGDALFIGDVGRTDFYPERAAQVAGLLFDSLRKIEALGDQTIVHPAHGAGSVCGDNMADREFSTIGYERLNNPMFALRDRDAFVERKLREHHYQPPYFRLMERLNLEGGAPTPQPLMPRPLGAVDLPLSENAATLVDVRGVTAFLGAHLPGSLAIPHDMLEAFAGWLLDPGEDLILVADDARQAEAAALSLARIGYDRVAGFLKPALTGWASGARPFRTVPACDVEQVARLVEDAPPDWRLLDVRGKPEVEAGTIAGALPVYVGQLPDRLDALKRDRRYTVMCASGARATIAASVLLRAGFPDVSVFLGSMGAWTAAGHPTTSPKSATE